MIRKEMPPPPTQVALEKLQSLKMRDISIDDGAADSPDQLHLSHPSHLQPRISYEELKIKDGPLYSLSAPSRNVSSEYLPGYVEKEEVEANDASSSSLKEDRQGVDAVSSWSTTPLSPFARRSPIPATTSALLIVDVQVSRWYVQVFLVPTVLVESLCLDFLLELTLTNIPFFANEQPEYWSNCPAVRKDFPEFPHNLAKTIEICRRRRAKIIWVRADYRYSHSPWLLQFERIRGPRNLGEVPCDPSSPSFTSWENFARPQGGEVIIAKSSWSSTSNTALMDIMRTAGIETVMVCGLITSVCVQHSAFGIFEAGYRTLLVTDACADRGRPRHEAALALYGDYMYELVTSDDLECEKTGLIPAEPVWLTLDAKTRMVRANSFPEQPDSSSVLSSTHSPPQLEPVVHYHPHPNKPFISPPPVLVKTKSGSHPVSSPCELGSTTSTVCSSSSSSVNEESSSSSGGTMDQVTIVA